MKSKPFAIHNCIQRKNAAFRDCRTLLCFCVPIVVTAAAILSQAQFISSDSYTRYELLAPDTHQFRIYYEVTETRPGARFHFNPIREGSVATDESVLDALQARRSSSKSSPQRKPKPIRPTRISARPAITSRFISRVRSRLPANIV